MHALLALTLLIAQPAPREARESKIDPFIADAIKPDDKDTPLRKLQKERVRERAEAIGKMRQSIEVGRNGPEYLGECVKLQSQFAENLAELMDKPAEKVKCYEMRLANLKDFERLVAARVQAGADTSQNLNLARAARIDAEIDLLKMKGSMPVTTGAEAIVLELIANTNDLVTLIDKKESTEKIKAAAQKMKATADKLEALKLNKEEQDRLKKYEAELQAALERMGKALQANPDAAKVIDQVRDKK